MPKILITDDEQGFRDLLMYELDSRGYSVDVAVDGSEAVQKSLTEVFDVVVTDLTMPQMSGLDVLDAMKKNTPRTEVILATGYITPELISECLNRGAFDYISKPFKVDDLCSMIERAVKKSQGNK